MNKYQKGRRFEYEVIKLFKDNGYEAIRTAGSHSPFDIILIKYTPENKKIAHVAFIQCKIKTLNQKLPQDSKDKDTNTNPYPPQDILDTF